MANLNELVSWFGREWQEGDQIVVVHIESAKRVTTFTSLRDLTTDVGPGLYRLTHKRGDTHLSSRLHDNPEG